LTENKFESLKYIFEVIESSSLLRELGSQKDKHSEFTIHPFQILKETTESFEKFTFHVGNEVFETSILKASLLSDAAFSMIRDNVYSMTINISSRFDYFEYLSAFRNIFLIQLGFPLSIDESNIQIYSSISRRLQIHELSEFLKSFEHHSQFSEHEMISLLSKFPTFTSTFLSESIENISKSFSEMNENNLLKIHPQNLMKILQSPSLLIESNDSLFDFLEKYIFEWGCSSSFLFQFVDFRLLSISKLKEFFKTTLKTHFSNERSRVCILIQRDLSFERYCFFSD
jgi:hypothetical protein